MVMSLSVIKTSAPANVMLLGEHAVLHGHSAIVCALSPRVHASLLPSSDCLIHIDSQLGSFSGTWADLQNTDMPELSFVMQCIRTVFAEKINQGFTLSIHSEFSHTVGLGSSAAVVASCAYALLLYKASLENKATVDFDDVFDIGLTVIHAVQKRGSGSDLAASVYGGLVSYRPNPREILPLIAAENLKSELSEQNNERNDSYSQLDLFYCGYKTPTPEVIDIVRKTAQELPDVYQSLYQQMNEVTLAAKQAITQNDWHKLGKLMNIYHGLLDALGVSDLALSTLVYEARKNANVLGAKISGSGLGDCIITLSKVIDNNVEKQSTIMDSSTISAANDSHIAATISPNGLLRHE